MRSERRAKAAAAATVLGLAALGGAALGSNHGPTAPIASVAGSTANGRAPIVTGASGSTTTAAHSAVLSSTTEAGRAPIVTRSSTVPGAAATIDN